MIFEIKFAQESDILDIKSLMKLTIRTLQTPFLTSQQIEASFADMGNSRNVYASGLCHTRAEGFKAAQMVSTLAGRPAYEKCGYRVEAKWNDTNGAVPVPLLTMSKIL